MSRQTNLISFCDTEGILTSKDIALIEGGNAPSKTISLSPETFAAVCKLRVTSPNNHVISMQFVESTVNLHRSLMFNNTERHPPCTMSIVSVGRFLITFQSHTNVCNVFDVVIQELREKIPVSLRTVSIRASQIRIGQLARYNVQIRNRRLCKK